MVLQSFGQLTEVLVLHVLQQHTEVSATARVWLSCGCESLCLLYLDSVLSSLVSHLGSVVGFSDAGGDLAVGLCDIHNPLCLGFFHQPADKERLGTFLLTGHVTTCVASTFFALRSPAQVHG